jgi:hypothetical protein
MFKKFFKKSFDFNFNFYINICTSKLFFKIINIQEDEIRKGI